MNGTQEPVIETQAVTPVTPEPFAPVPTAFVVPGVVPADCGCGGNGKNNQYVYVIGDRIGYDFGSRVRQFSLQANADPAYSRMLSDPAAFLRYLLGSRKFGSPINGNLHDAKSVHWVLYQDNCPRYVVQPLGDFSETLYKALVTFLIETTSFGFDAQGKPIEFTDPALDIRYQCLKEYFDCYGGASDPIEPGTLPSSPEHQQLLDEEKRLLDRFRAIQHRQMHEVDPAEKPRQGGHPEPAGAAKGGGGAAKGGGDDPLEDLLLFMNETPSRASKVAIAGTLANKEVTLANGQTVQVIHPDLRGMSTWNTLRLLRVALRFIAGPQDAAEADGWGFVARITSRLYELTRNRGTSPEERAINWAATAFLQQVRPLLRSRIFRDLVGGTAGLKAGAVHDVQVRPASCQESGGEYDVEISLFSVESDQRGLTVVSSTVDVSDVVPITLSQPRVFNRRS